MRIFYNLLQVREPAADVARRLRLTFTFPFYNQLQSNYFPFSALFFAWVFPTIPQQSLKTTVKGKPSKKMFCTKKLYPSNSEQQQSGMNHHHNRIHSEMNIFHPGTKKNYKRKGRREGERKMFSFPALPPPHPTFMRFLFHLHYYWLKIII